MKNSKGYAESPEFLPALGLFFKKKSVATTPPFSFFKCDRHIRKNQDIGMFVMTYDLIN